MLTGSITTNLEEAKRMTESLVHLFNEDRLRKLVLFSSERPSSGRPIPTGGLREYSNVTRGNVLKPKDGTFNLDVRKALFHLEVVITGTGCPEKLRAGSSKHLVHPVKGLIIFHDFTLVWP